MSYGGSSVIATFLAIGLLQSIHAQALLNRSPRSRAPTPLLR
jgi:cell division protein FtsW (lipid II flippase)